MPQFGVRLFEGHAATHENRGDDYIACSASHSCGCSETPESRLRCSEMAAKPKLDGIIGALEYDPRIASRLGLYLAQMTTFEMAIDFFFGILVGLEKETVEEVFGRILSINTRIEIIDGLVNRHKHPAELDTKKMEDLILAATKINKRRNEYVHGTYLVDPETCKIQLVTWLTSTSKKQKIYSLTADMLDEDIREMRSFMWRLGELKGGFSVSAKSADIPPLP